MNRVTPPRVNRGDFLKRILLIIISLKPLVNANISFYSTLLVCNVQVGHRLYFFIGLTVLCAQSRVAWDGMQRS